MAKEPTGEPTWRWRRTLIFVVVAVAMWRLIELEGAADNTLNQVLAQGWLWVLFGLLSVYTGFASAQDLLAIFTTRSGRPYAKVPEPAEETKP